MYIEQNFYLNWLNFKEREIDKTNLVNRFWEDFESSTTSDNKISLSDNDRNNVRIAKLRLIDDKFVISSRSDDSYGKDLTYFPSTYSSINTYATLLTNTLYNSSISQKLPRVISYFSKFTLGDNEDKQDKNIKVLKCTNIRGDLNADGLRRKLMAKSINIY